MSDFYEQWGAPKNPVALRLPVEPLAELRALWATGDDEALRADIVRLTRDIFNGFDGELHALAGIPPYLNLKENRHA